MRRGPRAYKADVAEWGSVYREKPQGAREPEQLLPGQVVIIVGSTSRGLVVKLLSLTTPPVAITPTDIAMVQALGAW